MKTKTKTKTKTKRLQTPIPIEEWQAISDLMWAAVKISKFTNKPIFESLKYLINSKEIHEL